MVRFKFAVTLLPLYDEMNQCVERASLNCGTARARSLALGVASRWRLAGRNSGATTARRLRTMFQRLLSQIFLPVLIIAIGVSGLLWLSAKDAPPERVAKQPAPLLVETIELQPGVSSFQIHVGGNVVPRREVTLSAEVAGVVVFKGDAVESGRHVQKGTPLLQIDPARFEL